jgi:hypothetical protein
MKTRINESNIVLKGLMEMLSAVTGTIAAVREASIDTAHDCWYAKMLDRLNRPRARESNGHPKSKSPKLHVLDMKNCYPPPVPAYGVDSV